MVESDIYYWKLEYEDFEIHSILSAILEYKGIYVYDFKSSFNQENQEKSQIFPKTPLIFEHNGILWVNLYPMVLPSEKQHLFYFKEKLLETLIFLNETIPNFFSKTAIFIFAIKNNTQHWLAGTLQINLEGTAVFGLIDPIGEKPMGLLKDQRFMELNNVLKEMFENFEFNNGAKIKEWKFDEQQINFIENDPYYSGGAVRRIIEGIIFNHEPFDWQNLDLEKFKSKEPNKHNFITERREDFELLLNSKKVQIKKCGKILRGKYNDFEILFKQKLNTQETSFFTNVLIIWNKYKKFYNDNIFRIDWNEIMTDDEIIKEIFRNFKFKISEIAEIKVQNHENEDLQYNWLEFLIQLSENKDYQDYLPGINRINETLFPNENLSQPPNIFSEMSLENSNITQSKSIKAINNNSTRMESTKKVENEGQKLLLEYFLEDNDKCIYFPRKRFLTKMKLFNPEITKKIEEIVQKLRNGEDNATKTKLDQGETQFNICLGALLIEFHNNETQIIALQNQGTEFPDTDLNITFDHIKKRYEEKIASINEKERELQKINETNISQEVLNKLIDLESNFTNLTEFSRFDEDSIQNQITILKEFVSNNNPNCKSFWNYTLDEWEVDFKDRDIRLDLLAEIKKYCMRMEGTFLNKYMLIQFEIDSLRSQRRLYNKKYFTRGKLDENKLKSDIHMIRGHSESFLINKFKLSEALKINSDNIKTVYILIVSTNEICSACTNIVPEITELISNKLGIKDKKTKIHLLYFPFKKHKEGNLFIKLSAEKALYTKSSDSALHHRNIIFDADQNVSLEKKSVRSGSLSNYLLNNAHPFFSESLRSKSKSNSFTSSINAKKSEKKSRLNFKE